MGLIGIKVYGRFGTLRGATIKLEAWLYSSKQLVEKTAIASLFSSKWIQCQQNLKHEGKLLYPMNDQDLFTV